MGCSNVYFSLNAKITTVFRREEKKLVSEMGISSLSCLSCLSQRNGCCACFGTQMWGEGKKTFFLYPPLFSRWDPVHQNDERQVNKRKTKVHPHVHHAYSWEPSGMSNGKRWLELGFT